MKTYTFFLVFFFGYASFAQQKHSDDTNQVLRIPVVFHVVHNNIPYLSLKKERFERLLKGVNAGFTGSRVQNKGANTKIEFYIPDNVFAKNGEKRLAISWHPTTKSFFSVKYHLNQSEQTLDYDESLKKYGYIDSKQYLNIWLCTLKGSSGNSIFDSFSQDEKWGYSSFPTEINDLNDGVVLRLDPYNISSNSSVFWVTHEIGHYLGLYHIWGKKERCDNDDEICDTPRQEKPNLPQNVENGEILKECTGLLDTNYENFMDYAEVPGMFTSGQKDRMRYSILEYRKNLLKTRITNESSTVFENTTESEISGGKLCLTNNYHKSFRIEIINVITGFKKEILLSGKRFTNPRTEAKGCLFLLPSGVYKMKSFFTTGAKSLSESYEVLIENGKTTVLVVDRTF